MPSIDEMQSWTRRHWASGTANPTRKANLPPGENAYETEATSSNGGGGHGRDSDSVVSQILMRWCAGKKQQGPQTCGASRTPAISKAEWKRYASMRNIQQTPQQQGKRTLLTQH